MNPLSILLDRHFPYQIKTFNHPSIKIIQRRLPSALPKVLGRIYHVWDLYFNSFRNDVVLGNRRSALLLGLLYHIYKPKKISLVGYEIIFNFKDSFKHKLVKWVWQMAVKNIDRLVVMTDSERQYLSKAFHTELSKFKTIRFYTENAHYLGPDPNGYIFAAGRMERDFETLIKAVSGTTYPTVIVADKSQQKKLESKRPDNVKILYNIPKEEYNYLLEKSKLVVVPLYQGAASRGQVVILEAMKYGKPVISSKVDGTADYYEEGKEGFFVEAGNDKALRQIFNSLFNDFEQLEKLGREAFKTQREKYAPEIFDQHYLALITEEYNRKNPLKENKLNKKPASSSALKKAIF